ncbi:MAG: TIGR03986 family CRISPR-associated RAMP protein [Oscillospiraceae bacterium]|jgi:CRISPR-associated protein (TIGR03986 family)|nr:TIGR03986 family CRISPR-associated RAMP protein [Oscillospiraceae bacterium]
MSFVNPYNFVTLEDSCEKKNRDIPINAERSGETLYTGEFVCELTTLTPLFIPNTTNDNTFPDTAKQNLDKYNSALEPDGKKETETSKSYDFFSYSDMSIKGATPTQSPVIPGSSIRGVIRSVFETVTNSCMSTSDGKETPLYRRTPAAKSKFGVIKNGKLYYSGTEKLLVKVDNPNYSAHPFGAGLPLLRGLANGQEIWVTPTQDRFIKKIKNRDGTFKMISLNRGVASKNPVGEGVCGYYLKGEPFGTKKHFDAVMVPNLTSKPYVLTDRDKERLKKLIELYSHDKDGVNQTLGHNEYKDFLDAEVKPVYYSEVGGKYYISPASITKEVFDRTIAGILQHQGGFNACSRADNLCEACHLFGMIEKGEMAKTRSSRVSFRDAIARDAGDYMGDVTSMAILGSPKITATEFYMQQPRKNNDVFNYDYETINKQSSLLRDDAVRLRGRKYYWHHGTEPKSAGLDDKPKQYQITRPVLKGKTFVFTVAFERLTLDELRKLRYSLELDETHAHKMGHGKPIGYGSARVKIDRDKSRVFTLSPDFVIVCASLPDAAYEFTYDNADFLALTDISAPKKNVSYPRGTYRGKPTVYDWFVLNREANGGTSTNPRFAYVLPRASAQDVTLPEITKRDREITQGRGSNRAVVWDSFNKSDGMPTQ